MTYTRYSPAVIALLIAHACHLADAAQPGGVIVSIKPLHSLVQNVMGDTAQANLLISGNTSPHNSAIRPSQIKRLHQADVVFYIDDDFESFLRNALKSLPPQVRRKAVAQQHGLKLLAFDNNSNSATHTDSHTVHAPDLPHHHGNYDLHIWLDPDNAKTIALGVARTLTEIYPQHRNIYRRNANALVRRITALDTKIRQDLSEVRGTPFFVFHNAYQYFERRYGLNHSGVLALNAELPPSAAHIRKIRRQVQTSAAACIFIEPQFSRKPADLIAQGNKVRIGTLDPLGAELEAGTDLYFRLMETLAQHFKQCLQ